MAYSPLVEEWGSQRHGHEEASAIGVFSRVGAVIRNSLLVKRTIALDVVPGVLVGAGLAILTALLLIHAEVNAMQTTVNGWNITLHCGQASNGPLLQAACTRALQCAILAVRCRLRWLLGPHARRRV